LVDADIPGVTAERCLSHRVTSSIATAKDKFIPDRARKSSHSGIRKQITTVAAQTSETARRCGTPASQQHLIRQLQQQRFN